MSDRFWEDAKEVSEFLWKLCTSVNPELDRKLNGVFCFMLSVSNDRDLVFSAIERANELRREYGEEPVYPSWWDNEESK